MTPEHAETIALRALGWIAAEDGLLEVFMGASGLGIDDLRGAGDSPEMLASVLDFLVMDDAWVVGFCDTAKLSYETPMQARAALPGGQLPHWT
ncbi:MAG: DUF3572 domain-containing protein [Celeribacter sp.]|jgi:hypothetical protein